VGRLPDRRMVGTDSPAVCVDEMRDYIYAGGWGGARIGVEGGVLRRWMIENQD
jgi:hypothetical protein